MKPATMMMISALLAAAVASGVSWVAWNSQSDGGNELERDDPTTRLDASEENIQKLQDNLDSLQNDQARFGQMVAALSERMTSRDWDKLMADMAAIQEKLDEAPPTLRLSGGTEDELALEEYIAKRVDSAAKKRESSRRARDFKRAQPFIKMGMDRELKKLQKKLNLTDNQSELMTASMNRAFDEIFPKIEGLMQPGLDSDTRTAQFEEITQAMTGITSEAQSYLNPEQYEQFNTSQQQHLNNLNAMMGAFGGSGGNQGGDGN